PRVRPSTPAFEAQYANLLTADALPPVWALTDDMLMMRPEACCTIEGATALHQLKYPLRLTFRVRSHASAEISSRPLGCDMPALLTSTSMRPHACNTLAARSCTCAKSLTSPGSAMTRCP